MKRNLDDLSDDASDVLDALLLALLRPIQTQLAITDEEMLETGRNLLAAGLITILEHPNGDFSLRAEVERLH